MSTILQQVYEGNITQQIYALYLAPWLAYTARRPVGTNIFERDWDMLVVLDACRVDALREVAPEYSWISGVDSTTSVGSASKEWMMNTFLEEYRPQISETACVSANSWVDTVLRGDQKPLYHSSTKESWLTDSHWLEPLLERDVVNQDDFASFDSVGFLADDNDYRVTSADQVTDWAIRRGRESDAERLLVHYMQPHEPYIADAVAGGDLERVDERPFEALRGESSLERVWESYLDNLRYVLDSVEVLLNNVDADRTVITADHGELFGEWGLYGHISGVLHPSLKRVPWVTTRSEDREEHHPEISLESEGSYSSETVQERLEHLGYA